jgi:polyferredoxin
MIVSTLVLGVWLGTQFSLSSLTLLMSGVWIRGVASYAALLCLVLAILVFLITRKNLYCATLCPFGAVQDGLGRITGCSPPPRYPWLVWTARIYFHFLMLDRV